MRRISTSENWWGDFSRISRGELHACSRLRYAWRTGFLYSLLYVSAGGDTPLPFMFDGMVLSLL